MVVTDASPSRKIPGGMVDLGAVFWARSYGRRLARAHHCVGCERPGGGHAACEVAGGWFDTDRVGKKTLCLEANQA